MDWRCSTWEMSNKSSRAFERPCGFRNGRTIGGRLRKGHHLLQILILLWWTLGNQLGMLNESIYIISYIKLSNFILFLYITFSSNKYLNQNNSKYTMIHRMSVQSGKTEPIRIEPNRNRESYLDLVNTE